MSADLPGLRVVRGEPTEAELVALVATFAAAGANSEPGDGDEPMRSQAALRWQGRWNGRGADAWRWAER